MNKGYKFIIEASWSVDMEFEVEAENEEDALRQAQDHVESEMGNDVNHNSLDLSAELSPGQDISDEEYLQIFGEEEDEDEEDDEDDSDEDDSDEDEED